MDFVKGIALHVAICNCTQRCVVIKVWLQMYLLEMFTDIVKVTKTTLKKKSDIHFYTLTQHIYVFTHVHTCLCMHIFAYMWPHSNLCMCVHTYLYTCSYTHTEMYLFSFLHTHLYIYIWAYVFPCTHKFTPQHGWVLC